jgi:hypothetical protein
MLTIKYHGVKSPQSTQDMTMRKNVSLAKNHLKNHNPVVSIVRISSTGNANLVHQIDLATGGQAYPFTLLLASPKQIQVCPSISANTIHSFQNRHEA